MKKQAEILVALKQGERVADICRRLHVSTVTVVAVRRGMTDKPAGPRYSFRPVWKFAELVRLEIEKRGVSVTEFFNLVLRDRYERMAWDHENGYIPQDDCGCKIGDIIRNPNSKKNRDYFICSRCGRLTGVMG